MRSWAEELPVGRVVRLDAGPDALALAVDPLPESGPAVVTYFAAGASSVGEVVESVLRELDRAAIALFPAWLPGAAGTEGPGGVNLPAVRALALRRAAASEHFGPFLAELAERSLTSPPQALAAALEARGAGPITASVFAPEVRAAGLVRVLADSFGRRRAAILVRVPDGLGPRAQEVLAGACEWLAQRSAAGVWLTGAPLDAIDRIPTVSVHLDPPSGGHAGSGHAGGGLVGGGEPGVGEPGGGEVLTRATAPRPPAVGYPAVAGRPHPGSRSEQALEAALTAYAWAAGRAWNQTYHPHPLAAPIRVDLMWERERCVVEIDGPDHRGAAKFADDRQRDVRLQLDGYAVLRFPDFQVLTDMDTVIRQIGQFLRGRRGTEG
ncbi:hypothetical protein GCM10022419_050280 [Nonomuraea rosea]|uniref:DUF559 domain-containing protein n=1 Tax=Nonomuraea rosea TaxID=638574 RepID=A0ABP6X947_9ACTN